MPFHVLILLAFLVKPIFCCGFNTSGVWAPSPAPVPLLCISTYILEISNLGKIDERSGFGKENKVKESSRKHTMYCSLRRLRGEKRSWGNICSRLRTWNPASVREQGAGASAQSAQWVGSGVWLCRGRYYEWNQACVPVQGEEGVWEKFPGHVGLSFYYSAFFFIFVSWHVLSSYYVLSTLQDLPCLTLYSKEHPMRWGL